MLKTFITEQHQNQYSHDYGCSTIIEHSIIEFFYHSRLRKHRNRLSFQTLQAPTANVIILAATAAGAYNCSTSHTEASTLSVKYGKQMFVNTRRYIVRCYQGWGGERHHDGLQIGRPTQCTSASQLLVSSHSKDRDWSLLAMLQGHTVCSCNVIRVYTRQTSLHNVIPVSFMHSK